MDFITHIDDESPVTYAHNIWNKFVSESNRKDRNSKGQIATSPNVARYMASKIPLTSESIDLLDPGAGTGILTAAVGERIVEFDDLKEFNVELYENDPKLAKYLRNSMSYLRKWLLKKGVSLNVNIKMEDFVIVNENLFSSTTDESEIQFDSVIMNPPYFKINKSDRRARGASSIIHGQPNIYALFMMLGALMLRNSGTMVSISPRSFASGLYFKKFRKKFFNIMHPVNIHMFSSRTNTFKTADVLQETIIMKSVKVNETAISSSMGIGDLDDSNILYVATNNILRESDGQVLFIPISDIDLKIMKVVENWPESISTLGLIASTGPVIPFRATEYLLEESKDVKSVPLIWMHNVHHMEVNWPLKINKQQYIENSNLSRKLLLPVSPYILLHRFSAKEQTRRLIAAPLDPYKFPFELIGIENHLNYIHRPKGILENIECIGIAAILCTKLLDKYIRIRSGNTQINASDLKSLPLPARDKILKIGKQVKKLEISDEKDLELLVIKELNLENLEEILLSSTHIV